MVSAETPCSCNFEGRQGPGARTMLSGVAVAAAAAVTGVISDPREVFDM